MSHGVEGNGQPTAEEDDEIGGHPKPEPKIVQTGAGSGFRC